MLSNYNIYKAKIKEITGENRRKKKNSPIYTNGKFSKNRFCLSSGSSNSIGGRSR
jgi:hypothetical protein